MSFLTLYIDDIPVAELILDLPVRDKGLTKETNYLINQTIIRNAIAEIKEANKSRIIEAGNRFYITATIKSVFPKAENNPAGREEKRKFDNLGNNFE